MLDPQLRARQNIIPSCDFHPDPAHMVIRMSTNFPITTAGVYNEGHTNNNQPNTTAAAAAQRNRMEDENKYTFISVQRIFACKNESHVHTEEEGLAM